MIKELLEGKKKARELILNEATSSVLWQQTQTIKAKYTDISALSSEGQEAVKGWNDFNNQLVEKQKEMDELQAKRDAFAEPCAKVLSALADSSVKVNDTIIKMTVKHMMISKPKYKELLETALPQLTEEGRKAIKELEEAQIKYEDKAYISAKKEEADIIGWVKGIIQKIWEAIVKPFQTLAEKFVKAVGPAEHSSEFDSPEKHGSSSSRTESSK